MSEFEGTHTDIPGVTGEGGVGNEYLMPRAYIPLKGPNPPSDPEGSDKGGSGDGL